MQTVPQDFAIDPYWPVAVVLAVTALGWLLVRGAYRWGAEGMPRRLKQWSLLLRGAVLVLLALCLVRPSAVLRQVLKEQGQVLVLVDTSASMGIADEPGGRSRAQSLAVAFEEAREAYDRLRSLYQVKQYEFAEELHPVDRLGFSSDGGRTALGDALTEALRGRLPNRLVGVIVATDGASNTGLPPAEAAQAYRKLGVPLYLVACGQQRVGPQARDVVLQHLEVPRAVFVRNVAVITATVTLVGVPGEPVAVRLRVDEKEVERQTIATRSDQEVFTVHFRYLPTAVGYHKVTVEAGPLPGERTTGNNRASAYLNVLSGGLSVLYLEGAVRWEFKFLRRALEEAREVDLKARILLGGAEGARPALKPHERWDGFHVVILGDLPRGRLTEADLKDLAQAVSQGAGLILLAGYQTYGAAFYRTALEPLVPFYLEPFTFQREGTYRVHPPEAQAEHPAVRLAENRSENLDLWSRLPELVGGVKAGRLKPAATTLLEDEAGEPILVVQPYGRGRVAALLADTTWRWALAGKPARELHRRFWRQLVLWAAGRETLERKHLWVDLPRTRYLPQEPVTAGFHLEDAQGKPFTTAHLTATLRRQPDGPTQTLRLYRTQDHWEALFTPPAEGDYLIEARAYDRDPASDEAQLIEEASARFLVERTNLELADPLAHIGLLSQLAEMTGGKMLRPDGLADLLETLAREHHEVTLERVHRRDLWNRPELLLVLVGLLAADWVLRKRSGLV